MKDEKIERVARALYEAKPGHVWTEADEATRQYWRTVVRMAGLDEAPEALLAPKHPGATFH
ncbi:hypothetical protein [Chelativorans sp. YIM 93263]|uniref:hypothetical protein n=1 Tax=Chelativorans sp. YIM 93263 TaxID=2906648 RepID=UPI002378B2C2|nr:hypothetical protein [Chelativorans sp. YIM 93263]